MRMKTLTNEDEARQLMITRNRTARDRSVFVMVEGPEDGEYTVMSLRDAIDNDFLYSWEV